MTRRRRRQSVGRPALMPLPLENTPVVTGFSTWAGTDLREDGYHGIVVAQITAVDATTLTEHEYPLMFTAESIRALTRSLTYSLRVGNTQAPLGDPHADPGHDLARAPASAPPDPATTP